MNPYVYFQNLVSTQVSTGDALVPFTLYVPGGPEPGQQVVAAPVPSVPQQASLWSQQGPFLVSGLGNDLVLSSDAQGKLIIDEWNPSDPNQRWRAIETKASVPDYGTVQGFALENESAALAAAIDGQVFLTFSTPGPYVAPLACLNGGGPGQGTCQPSQVFTPGTLDATVLQVTVENHSSAPLLARVAMLRGVIEPGCQGVPIGLAPRGQVTLFPQDQGGLEVRVSLHEDGVDGPAVASFRASLEPRELAPPTAVVRDVVTELGWELAGLTVTSAPQFLQPGTVTVAVRRD